MLTEGRGGAALTFCGNQMTVSAFVVLTASSPTPKRRVCLRLEGCLIPLGSPLSFWNELAVAVLCILVAMLRRPILSNALSRAFIP